MLRPTPRHWILVLAFAVTTLIYAKGLEGPFLFDDYVHITQNQWVKIESLEWQNLVRAWNSSFSPFPGNRPLSQLSFGINHALAGLDPWAFKVTNLIIHLLVGGLVFVFVRLAYRAAEGVSADRQRGNLLALAATMLWLLHPMHVSTVLYPVQRMTSLSALSLLGALSAYFYGRLKLAQGQRGAGWMIAAAPIAMLGFLAKENTVLLPLLLLISELTLLRKVATGKDQALVRTIWGVFILTPLLIGTWYLVSHHTELLVYEGRSFSLEERVLTQPRVLWLYLQWLFIPDISQFGLFHDDILVSSGLLAPPTTLVSIIGLVLLLLAALRGRKRAPLPAFAILFFFACHALESTILPLEMVFEHRNYLASVGPLMLLTYLVTIASIRYRVQPLAMTLGALLLVSYSVVTNLRVGNWSSYETFVMNSAENHPKSARSSFMAAQLLISALAKSKADAPALEQAARYFLHNGIAADPRCIDCLFGLVVLDLETGQQPAATLINRLEDALRDGSVGPTKLSLGQFSYLVNWQRGNGTKLAPRDLEAIFEAALVNPAWGHTGRAGIEAAYREYYEFVVEDLPRALVHARAAVNAWPQQWNYHMQLVRLLQKLNRYEEARVALDAAASVARNGKQKIETEKVAARIGYASPD